MTLLTGFIHENYCYNESMKDNTEKDNIKSGNLHIYPNLGQVKIGEQVIKLGPINMQVLMTLIENQGKVVSRAKLFDLVWKNQVVSDDTLTRCISDLRTHFSQYTEQSLIKTLPKRGYLWLPKVYPLVTEDNKPWLILEKKYLLWGVIIFASLFLLSASVLWVAQSQLRLDQVRIALIPIHSDKKHHQLLASDIESQIRKKIMKTDQLSLLSSTILTDRSENPFLYLSREFNAQWVVEGAIRTFKNKTRISINVVEARTALVIYSIVEDTQHEAFNLESMGQKIIDEMIKLTE